MRVFLWIGHDADTAKVSHFLGRLREKHPSAVILYVCHDRDENGTAPEELWASEHGLCSIQFNQNVAHGADTMKAAALRCVMEGNADMGASFGSIDQAAVDACGSWNITLHRR